MKVEEWTDGDWLDAVPLLWHVPGRESNDHEVVVERAFPDDLDSTCICAYLEALIAEAMGMKPDVPDGDGGFWQDEDVEIWLRLASKVLAALIEAELVKPSDYRWDEEANRAIRN